MRMVVRWIFGTALAAAMLGGCAVAAAAQAPDPPVAPEMQSSGLAMTTPAACPYSGCAAGQRLNMRFDFEPSGLGAAFEGPNLQICLYAPTSWAVTDADSDATGEVTGQPYTPPAQGARGCAQDTAPPAGYSLILERVTRLDSGAFADAIHTGFRVGPGGTGTGRVLARLFTQGDPGVWTRIQQSTSPTLTITPAASPSYVAADPNACGTAGPCYVNSAEDRTGGIGTGLKDAVDAVPGNRGAVVVLGSYPIKSRSVEINRPVVLSGMGDARLTVGGTGPCDAPVLSLRAGVTVRGLNINDGACANPNRTLLEVDSPSGVVLIAQNDLTAGGDAIFIKDNAAPVVVRSNAIYGNAGLAVRAQGTTASLEITANNLHSNGGGVDCSEGATEAVEGRKANHNYWGSSAATAEATHCTLNHSKRLGMPIALEPYLPGVRAIQVTVTKDKTYNAAFDRLIAYNHTGDEDFALYLVDHGYATAGGPPFSYVQGRESPSPCSNYWDVFLPEGVKPKAPLELYFRYDRTPACQAAINSSMYCGQTTTMNKYPLYWFDPSAETPRWVTTGTQLTGSSEGQVTACDTALNEIRVTLDNSGRPNLTSDLGYTPFMVGVPVLRSFLPLASLQTITVTWTTNAEPDVVGFYVWRGPDARNLSPISDLIGRQGTALFGRTYAFVDADRENNVPYAYRLQILRADGTSIYSAVEIIAANRATITPTPTRAPTFTPRPTNTPIPTFIPTRLPTRIPTSTLAFRTATPIPTNTIVLATRTPTIDLRTPGAPATATALSQTQIAAARTLTIASIQALTRTPASGSSTDASGDYPPPQGGDLPDGATDGASGGTPIAMRTGDPPDGTAYPGEVPETGAPGTETSMPASQTAAPGAATPSPGLPGAAERGGGDGGPWLSLGLGILAGLGLTGGLGGLWYLLRVR